MNKNAIPEALHGKRIGLVACTAIEAVIASALTQVQASFAIVPANAADLGDSTLDRFDALILGVGEKFAEWGGLRPETVRNHDRPLLLAGPPEAIYCSEILQAHADDVILAPFSKHELLFRLYRITGGKALFRQTAVRSGRPLVLVADDDRDMTIYLEGVLKNLNVDVHCVDDGRAALTAVRQLLPDLLLLDIGLPTIDGLGVLRRLRNDPGTRDLATILLTASSDPSHVSAGADLGALDYILKPFDRVDLTRKLKAHVGIKSMQPYPCAQN